MIDKLKAQVRMRRVLTEAQDADETAKVFMAIAGAIETGQPLPQLIREPVAEAFRQAALARHGGGASGVKYEAMRKALTEGLGLVFRGRPAKANRWAVWEAWHELRKASPEKPTSVIDDETVELEVFDIEASAVRDMLKKCRADIAKSQAAEHLEMAEYEANYPGACRSDPDDPAESGTPAPARGIAPSE